VSEIDWNVELRKIVREYDGLHPERPRRVAAAARPPSRTQLRLQKIQEITARARFNDRLSEIGIWARLALVAILALSLFWWPYGHSCGFPLVAFLLSNSMVIVGGTALVLRGWRDRVAWLFSASALCIVVAWTVMALHILPRLGYSSAGGARVAWTCAARR
jgi:hypothetical protein